ENTDREQFLRAGVVGDLEAGFLLNHYYSLSKPKAYLAFSTISTRRQRLVALSGRVSLMTTRSPMPAELVSSCTLRFSVRRMTLPYSGCFTRSSTSTTMVLSILSLTT